MVKWNHINEQDWSMNIDGGFVVNAHVSADTSFGATWHITDQCDRFRDVEGAANGADDVKGVLKNVEIEIETLLQSISTRCLTGIKDITDTVDSTEGVDDDLEII